MKKNKNATTTHYLKGGKENGEKSRHYSRRSGND